jgi:hypothetical protein
MYAYSIRFRKSQGFYPKGFNHEGSVPKVLIPKVLLRKVLIPMSGAENSMHVISISFFNFFQKK